MEKRMERSLIYNGTITAEQFLFYEIRITSLDKGTQPFVVCDG